MKASTATKSASSGSTEAVCWFTAGRFAAFLGTLIVAAFPAVVTGQRTFVFGDYGLFGYPLAYYHRESFWRGEVPLWNPLSDFGLPFLAQWNTLTCYPLSLIYLLLPLPWSLGLYLLFHLFLAGVGMYLLAARWTANRLGAASAGVAYAFSGLLLNCLIWPNNIAALGWMPWVVRCADRAMQRGTRNVYIAATVGAMQMLTGAPEIIVFTWTIVLLLCAGRCLRGAPARRLPLQRLAVVACVVTGLAAVQLLPFLDLLAHSQRDTSQANTECAMPISGWANFLVPLFRCTGSRPGMFFQGGQFWTSSYYLSLVVVVSAWCAVWLVRAWQVRLLAGVTGVCLILAMGDQAYLYAWLRRAFPPINFVNFPVKFVVPVTFCVPLLAAFAIRECQRARAENKARAVRSALVVGILAVGAILAILWYAHLVPKPYEQWPRMWKNGLSRALLLALTLGAFYWLERSPPRRLHPLLNFSMLGLIWLDGLTHTPNQNPSVPPYVFEPKLPAVQKLVPLPHQGESRVMLSAAALKKFRTALLSDLADTYLGHRLGLYFDCNLLEDIPKAGGFYSLYLTEQIEAIFALYAPSNGIAPALADFMSVSQISSASNLLEWTARTNYLPMATAGQRPVFTDPTNSLLRLLDPAFNPREVVFLPLAPKPLLTATNRTEAKIQMSHFTAHRVEFQVAAEQPALVVLSQSFYHPWRASVDGHPTDLWRANHAFQALEVPAGTHQVKLAYEDRFFRAGALISWFSLLAAWLALRRWRSRVPVAQFANPPL